MNLEGQVGLARRASSSRRDLVFGDSIEPRRVGRPLPATATAIGNAEGYAMAALLTVLAVMSIVLGAALPVWQHEMRREKEAELAFRGEQYVRAIYLFQRRYPGTYPPNIDVLVEQKFLRKKYKDPITGDDFALLRVGQLTQQQRPGMPGSGQQQQQQAMQAAQPSMHQGPGGSQLPQAPGALGGIIGVASKSTADSIRIYQGRTKYDQWPFVYAGAAGRPGPGGMPGQQRPGMPGVGGPRSPGQPGAPGQGPTMPPQERRRPGPGTFPPGQNPRSGGPSR